MAAVGFFAFSYVPMAKGRVVCVPKAWRVWRVSKIPIIPQGAPYERTFAYGF